MLIEQMDLDIHIFFAGPPIPFVFSRIWSSYYLVSFFECFSVFDGFHLEAHIASFNIFDSFYMLRVVVPFFQDDDFTMWAAYGAENNVKD